MKFRVRYSSSCSEVQVLNLCFFESEHGSAVFLKRSRNIFCISVTSKICNSFKKKQVVKNPDIYTN